VTSARECAYTGSIAAKNRRKIRDFIGLLSYSRITESSLFFTGDTEFLLH
jgi:hypothetical protein